MKTYTVYLKYKEDNLLDVYHYFSIEELLEVGNPIDEDGIDMELFDESLYKFDILIDDYIVL